MPQPWQELSFKNKHPRDDSISFDEPTHTYTVNGTYKGWTSCTGFIHKFFPHFDADADILLHFYTDPIWITDHYRVRNRHVHSHRDGNGVWHWITDVL